MGNMTSVRKLLDEARDKLTPKDFKIFVDIKVAQDIGGNNALLYACNSSASNYILVNYLINEAGADPNTMNDYAINCLLIATKKAQLNILNLLLKNGVDIGFADKNGCNALHIASSAGYQDIVQDILIYWSKRQQQAKREGIDLNASGTCFDVNTGDKQNTTCLMKAAINGHYKIIELLLRFGASPSIENNKGENALTLACMQENFAICEKLIVAKGDVNHVDSLGRTPLLKAARHNSNSDILQLLLQHGADPTISDNNKNTPLHFAAIRGTKDVAIFLIKLGANPYA
jgi:ankyrin repeat protein